MANSPPIVAIGLLTQHELELLGQGFDRAFPINDDNAFEDLLRAIDQAEQDLLVRNHAEPQIATRLGARCEGDSQP